MNHLKRFFVSFVLAVLFVVSVNPVVVSADEKVAERTYSSKTFAVPEGKQTVFHQKWIHYMDKDGKWQDIKTSLKAYGDYFVMDNAPFTFSAPKSSSGEAAFVSNNRYDVGSKKLIEAPAFTQKIKAVGVNEVDGKVTTFEPGWLGDKRDLNAKNALDDAVVYKGAYSDKFKGDLIYWVNYATQPRLEKLVSINENPNVSGDLKIDFILNFSDAAVIKSKGKVLENLQTGVVVNGGVSVTPANLPEDTARGLGIKDLHVWDSGKGKNFRKEKIQMELKQEADGSLRLTKIIPKAFLDSAVYPVYTDTDTTFNPNADPESTSVDGVTGYSANASVGVSWNDLRTAVGTGANSGGDGNYVQFIALLTTSNPGADYAWAVMYRGIFIFDTSSLPDGDTVSAADLKLYGNAKSVNGFSTSVNLAAVDTNSNNNLTDSDYNLSRHGNVPFTDAVALSGLATGGFQTFSLNGNGLSNISTTDVSQFSLRWNEDILGTEPTSPGSSLTAFWTVRVAEYAETSSDPQLVVTHAAADSSVPEFRTWIYLGALFICFWLMYGFFGKRSAGMRNA